MFFGWTSGWTSSGEGWMTELRNKDRFHPVVEILESDDGRLLALFNAHLWTQIVCEGDVNGRLSGGKDAYSDRRPFRRRQRVS